jgi:hypothetical protein
MDAARAARRAGALALVVAVGAALAVPVAAAPPKSQTTAAGTALAKKTTLKLVDVPKGWKPVKSSGSSGEITCASFNPDLSDLTSIGRADTGFESPDGIGNLASVARVFKTAGDAQAAWNRFVRPGLLGCMEALIEANPGKGTTVAVTSKGPLAVKVPGKRHAAYRIVADINASGDKAKLYLDLILQGGGPVQSVLILTWVVQPPTRALETKLASVVASRLPK